MKKKTTLAREIKKYPLLMRKAKRGGKFTRAEEISICRVEAELDRLLSL